MDLPFRILLGDWATLKPAARLVREEVFIQEQQIRPELEWDDMDDVCVHAVAYDANGKVLGSARLLPDGHIGRMAVRLPGRGNGVGGAILRKLMHEAQARGHGEVVLSAQIRAEKFYSRHGFVREGEEYIDAGIPHVQMRHVFPLDHSNSDCVAKS